MNIKASSLQEKAADWVVRINDPEASEADFSEWQAWLAESPAHREAYQALEHAWNRAAQVNVAPWPTEAELQSDGRRPVRWALAAGVVFAVIGSAAVWTALRSPSQLIQTATAEQRSMRLDDGSRVELAAESRLRVDLSDNLRSLHLEQGEAYFDVAQDKTRPFVVQVGATQVRAIGTAFNIERNGERATVTVTQGVVQISSATGVLRLQAGEQGRVDDDGPRKITAAINPQAAVAWREGRLEYLHEELRYVLDDVNRYVDRKIVVTDPKLAQLEFTGTVFLDHLDEWLTTLQGSFPVQIVERGERRELVREGK